MARGLPGRAASLHKRYFQCLVQTTCTAADVQALKAFLDVSNFLTLALCRTLTSGKPPKHPASAGRDRLLPTAEMTASSGFGPLLFHVASG